MKAKFRKIGIDLIPDTEDEIINLIKIWQESDVRFEKSGSTIHAGAMTHHSIINSSFFIKFLTEIK